MAHNSSECGDLLEVFQKTLSAVRFLTAQLAQALFNPENAGL